MRKGLVLAAFLAVAVLANGCQKESGKEIPASQAESTAPVSAETQAETEKAGEAGAQSDTRVFTDSAGREVTLPKEINKIAPSGPLAQIVLYTICPDKLSGLASDFSEGAKQYIDEKYWGLPKFGQFYGKNANLNMEALIAESPDVIIDIGEAKKTVKEDMDALQEQLNMPVIFIEADLDTMSSAYEKLGELTGETDQAKKLSEYCDNILKKSETARDSWQKRNRFIMLLEMMVFTPMQRVPFMPGSSNRSEQKMQPRLKRYQAAAEVKYPLNSFFCGSRILSLQILRPCTRP